MPIAKSKAPVRVKTSVKKSGASKRPGDVIGLAGAQPARKAARPAKTSRKRAPKGIEIGPVSRRVPELKPARVRG